MCAADKTGDCTPVSLPNFLQFYLDSEQGRKYLIVCGRADEPQKDRIKR
jgi:hypothetical protein